jgi:hypothetical protein
MLQIAKPLALSASCLSATLMMFLVTDMAAADAEAQTSVQIHDIMVAGSNPVVGTAATKTLPYSPYYGVNVSVTGIVVGIALSLTVSSWLGGASSTSPH